MKTLTHENRVFELIPDELNHNCNKCCFNGVHIDGKTVGCHEPVSLAAIHDCVVEKCIYKDITPAK